MRRLAAVSSIAGIVLALAAGPALAQRDPFEPAIDESGVEQPANGEAPAAEPPAEEPAPEPLANTGLEGRPWVALAYALVALAPGSWSSHGSHARVRSSEKRR